MKPLPPFERKPDDSEESHEQPTWPWGASSQDKETEKKPDKKDAKKKLEEPKKESEKPKTKPEKEKQPESVEEKDEKRQTLVEQSLALVTKYEEEPVPRDAPTLARVMIAHQVVHLHEQLEHPERFENDLPPDEIQATLDYIAQLDEKFQDPSTEASPEVEQSYQEILKLAEATLQEESNLETIVADLEAQQSNVPANSESSRSPITQQSASSSVEPAHHLSTGGMSPYRASRAPRDGSQPPVERPEGGDGGELATTEEFDRRKKATHDTLPAVAAATLISTIIHLGNKPKTKEEAETTTTQDSDLSNTPRVQQATAQPEKAPDASHVTAHEPSSQSEITHGERPLRWQPPAREHTPTPPRQPSSPLATAAMATTFAATRGRPQTTQPLPPKETTTTQQEVRPFVSPETHHTPSDHPAAEHESASDQRKIEHMPLLQLLDMAENISLGHGQYLRREFEAGHIDREGLVKIVKAHAKGRDYQFEYRQQANRFAKLKATSPEFLRQTRQSDDYSAEPESEPTEAQQDTDDTSRDEQQKAAIKPLTLAPPTEHPLLPESASADRPKPHTARRIALITVGSVVGLIAASLLAFGIFNLFN